MAPTTITEDYYGVLEVEQTATLETIIKSYKRLALLRHPDKNPNLDSTEEFQLLGRAYAALKDEGRRREYDLLYPRRPKRRRTAPRTFHDGPQRTAPRPFQAEPQRYEPDIDEVTEMQRDLRRMRERENLRQEREQKDRIERERRANEQEEWRTKWRAKRAERYASEDAEREANHPSTGPQETTSSPAEPPPETTPESKEVKLLAAMRKSMEARAMIWDSTSNSYDDAITQLHRDISHLDFMIQALDQATKTEEAAETAAQHWSARIFSSFFKKSLEAQEKQAESNRKANERIQRAHIRAIKEQDLENKQSELRGVRLVLEVKQQIFQDENQKAEKDINEMAERLRKIQLREKERREILEKHAKEKLERQRQDKVQEEWIARKKAEYAKWQAKEKEQRAKGRAEREAEMKEEDERRQRDAAEQVKEQTREATKNIEDPDGMNEKVAKITEQFANFMPPDHRTEPRSAANRSPSGLKMSCCHEGDWVEFYGPKACESCSETYNYLFYCHECQLIACEFCWKKLSGFGKAFRMPNESDRMEDLQG